MSTHVTPVDGAALTNFVSDKLLGGREITSDENLLLSGLVDSLGVMTLVAHLEEVTGAPVPMEDVILENFASIDAIVSYISSRS